MRLLSPFLLVLFCLSLAAQKREQFKNADVIYGWVSDNHGDQLRTFVTRPKTRSEKVPAIFFVGWLRRHFLATDRAIRLCNHTHGQARRRRKQRRLRLH